MTDYNSDIVSLTLKEVIKILRSQKIEYRFLGSVVVAAMNGKLYRNIGDLDLLVDRKGKERLFNALTKLGYKQAGGMFSFARKYMALETLEHPTLLGVGYFYGHWQDDGTFVMGNTRVSVTIEPHALKKTVYILDGVEFNGLPPEAIATGIHASEKNPKRQKELILLKDKNMQVLPNTYIHVRVFGFRADWVYHFVMTVLNIIGVIRVRRGLSFDPWR